MERFELGNYYQLISSDGEESIAYYYYNPEAGVNGFCWNVADGAGFIPEYDLRSDTKIRQVELVLGQYC